MVLLYSCTIIRAVTTRTVPLSYQGIEYFISRKAHMRFKLQHVKVCIHDSLGHVVMLDLSDTEIKFKPAALNAAKPYGMQLCQFVSLGGTDFGLWRC